VPDQLWVADLTYIPLGSRFFFSTLIFDAWSLKVVGYAIANTTETRLTLIAQDSGYQMRNPGPR
jgi:putative transposase